MTEIRRKDNLDVAIERLAESLAVEPNELRRGLAAVLFSLADVQLGVAMLDRLKLGAKLKPVVELYELVVRSEAVPGRLGASREAVEAVLDRRLYESELPAAFGEDDCTEIRPLHEACDERPSGVTKAEGGLPFCKKEARG